MKTITIDGWEYTIEDEQKGKNLSEITVPSGWQLWTQEDCIRLHNSHRKELNLEECWFFIEQPFNLNQEKEFVARFYANSVRAYLDCGGGPRVSVPGLGVRFKRRVKNISKINQRKIIKLGNDIEAHEERIKQMQRKVKELSNE